MLMVIPVVDMRMIAAKTLSGMLTAATIVERRLSRKTKIEFKLVYYRNHFDLYEDH